MKKTTKTRKHFVNIALEWNQSLFIVATTTNHAQQDTHLFNNNNNAMMMKKWCKNTCFTHKVNSIVLLLVIRFVWDKKKKNKYWLWQAFHAFTCIKQNIIYFCAIFGFLNRFICYIAQSFIRSLQHLAKQMLSTMLLFSNSVLLFHSFSLENSQHIAIFSTRKAPLPSFPRISVFHPFSSPAKAFQQ